MPPLTPGALDEQRERGGGRGGHRGRGGVNKRGIRGRDKKNLVKR